MFTFKCLTFSLQHFTKLLTEFYPTPHHQFSSTLYLLQTQAVQVGISPITYILAINFTINVKIGFISKQNPRREVYVTVWFVYYPFQKFHSCIQVIFTKILQQVHFIVMPFVIFQNAHDTWSADTLSAANLHVLCWGLLRNASSTT